LTPNNTKDVVSVATAAYLAGQPLDMAAMTAQLSLSRATLYRLIGNHDKLVGLVLAEQTERTFRLCVDRVSAEGLDRVRAVFGHFMYLMIGAEPLRAFVTRDPLLFTRIMLAPGHVEQRATMLFAKLLEDSGVEFSLPISVLAQAIVRAGDALMYSHLLRGHEPETNSVIALVNVLLDSAHVNFGPR
jgi:AcrR family transcriptional regulator